MATNPAFVIDTVLLMTPTERAETMQKLRELEAKAVTEAIAAIALKAKDQPVEKRVAKYVQIRDARAESNKRNDVLDKAYKDCLESIESSLLATSHEVGADSFKTPHGTAYKAEQLQCSIADENVFFNFVREIGDLDFFERRLKVTHIQEYVKEHAGQYPPGLNIFREFKMKVRRS